MTTQYKAGDLVRIQGAAFTSPREADTVRHHIKAGAVCVVDSVLGYALYVSGPIRKDCRAGHEDENNRVGQLIHQAVRVDQVKPAKQAMRKREAYLNRRG